MQDSTKQNIQDQIKIASGIGRRRESSSYQNGLEPKQRSKVVIVGAGLAGLAAAQRLHEWGVEDVIILDALNRVGGRVHTISHSDYLLELGAQWLHGADDNPLYQWLTGLGMLDDFENASLGFQGMFCTSSSEEIQPKLVKRVLDIVCESKLALSKDENYLNHLLFDGDKRKCKNASEVFRRHLEIRMAEEEDLSKQKQLVYAIFGWFLRYETIENCCDTMDEVSVQSYTDWTDLGEGTLLNFKDGYQSLLQWFCRHFPRSEWLHLNKEVLNIELLSSSADGQGNNNDLKSTNGWLDSHGRAYSSPILVKYRASSSSKQETKDRHQVVESIIECQHVIVTASLGFLKDNMQTFFTPALPQLKQDLINSIGFGTVNKIVLQFEAPFWQASGGGIKLVWRDSDFKSGPDALPEWCRDVLAFDVVRRQPNLLIGWIGGQGAKDLESLPDEQVGLVCLKILAKFLPDGFHQKATRLVACMCSRWHSNPFTRGSYSFQSMDSLGLNVDKLHEPIYNVDQGGSSPSSSSLANHLGLSSASRVPRIMFAGEATAGKLYSTTHGAIISGWREADRVTDHLSGNKRPANQSLQSASISA